ncbi:unnamed protein product [Spirodela intermedia]|uniref:Uncharacterized protein n=2 Tax=Spirodela intermedia TaxID=51605 RepID=A0A7I8KF49_SPIIN|nr:unnamed protein product [Spirodela intermedia]CAA6659843.1 unnamed protein product [Spirodela intermedia]CAA7396162.1 unnamed protein product [Spirodela intermedia]
MEEASWRRNLSSYGNWDYNDGCPIANYFDQAALCGNGSGLFERSFLYPTVLPHHCFSQDAETDLYRISPQPLGAAEAPFARKGARSTQGRKLKQLMQRTEEEYSSSHHFSPVKTSGGGAAEEKKPPRKHCGPKAVDEDLYKIPTELLYRKTRKKTTACEFLARCLRLNCIP